MGIHKGQFFLQRPSFFFDIWIQMIVPSEIYRGIALSVDKKRENLPSWIYLEALHYLKFTVQLRNYDGCPTNSEK